MGLKEWLRERRYRKMMEIEFERFNLMEQETTAKLAKLELQKQRIKLRWLKREERRWKKRKPHYIR